MRPLRNLGWPLPLEYWDYRVVPPAPPSPAMVTSKVKMSRKCLAGYNGKGHLMSYSFPASVPVANVTSSRIYSYSMWNLTTALNTPAVTVFGCLKLPL